MQIQLGKRTVGIKEQKKCKRQKKRMKIQKTLKKNCKIRQKTLTRASSLQETRKLNGKLNASN